MPIPTDEQLRAARDSLKKITLSAKPCNPTQDVAWPSLKGKVWVDYIEPGCELSQDQALTLLKLTDYLRDYRECAEH